MKDNASIFVVNTEIGLLVSLLYYLKYEKEKSEPIFVLLKENSNRFFNINTELLPGKTLIYINDLQRNIVFPKRKFLQVLKQKNINTLVFQNPLDFISQIIINFYRKKEKNLFVVMLSDGLLLERGISKKDYMKLSIKILIRKYFNFFPYLSNSLKLYPSMISKVDVFVAHKNIGAKHFIDTSLLIRDVMELNKNIVSAVFNFKLNDFVRAKMIVFTQPLLVQTYLTDIEKKDYVRTLEKLFLYASETKMETIIKLHPGDDISDYQKFTNEYITIDVQQNVPAEVILSAVSDKIVVSMFSSVSLYNTNFSNKHFWLYKLMNYKIKKLKKIEHISLPNTFKDFKSDILNFKLKLVK